jgi:hypothetical protein
VKAAQRLPLAAAERPAAPARWLAKAVRAVPGARDAVACRGCPAAGARDAAACRAYPAAAGAVACRAYPAAGAVRFRAYPAAAGAVRFRAYPVVAGAVRFRAYPVAADAVRFRAYLVAADAVRSLVVAPVATRARTEEPTQETERSSRSGCARGRVRAQPEIAFTPRPAVRGRC